MDKSVRNGKWRLNWGTMVEYREYDASYEEEVLKVFTSAFFKYPLFYTVFQGVVKGEKNINELYELLIKGIFKATIRKDECYIGFLNGRVASIVIIERPTSKPIGFWDYAVSGFPKVLFKLGIIKIMKYLTIADDTEIVVKRIKEPRWHLYFLAVDPAHQHEGIGSDAIQNFLIPLVKKNGGKLLTVTTNAKKNVKFYLDNGFSLVEEEKLSYYGNTIGNWTFRMDLND
ncbi:Acetyltransferase (GNAT) domain-containing protein [Lachnospiraceae bacterium NE2001]|nr:Acetyltransferase (GNAT) domain-containing protein [Lachnospiraceae bacterium NE2001]